MTARPRIFHGYYLATLSFCLGFTSGAVYLHSRGVLLRDQIVDFDISRTEVSLAFTAVQAAGMLFAPVLGLLLDRFPIRNVMAAGALWLGIGFFALSQVGSALAFAAVAALFVGLGTGAIGTTANSKLMVNWFDRRRGLAIGIAIMGYSVAGIVASPGALVLLDAIGWRGVYGLFGAVLLLVVVPAIVLLVKQGPWQFGVGPDGTAVAARAAANAEAATAPAVITEASTAPAVTTEGATARPAAAVFLSLSRSTPFWGVVLVFGLADGAYGGLNLHLFLHYTGLGVGDYAAALTLSAASALAIASKPLFGALADRLGARRASLIALGCCIMSMLAFASISTFPALLVAGGLFGIAFGGMVPLRASLLSRLFPPAEFGRAYGSFRLCIFPMTLIWTPLIGIVYDRTGSYVPAFGLLAAAFAAALAAAFALIPRDRLGTQAGESRVERAAAGS